VCTEARRRHRLSENSLAEGEDLQLVFSRTNNNQLCYQGAPLEQQVNVKVTGVDSAVQTDIAMVTTAPAKFRTTLLLDAEWTMLVIPLVFSLLVVGLLLAASQCLAPIAFNLDLRHINGARPS
jgi:hypothetical protein